MKISIFISSISMRTKLVLLTALILGIICSFAVMYFPAKHKAVVSNAFAEKSFGLSKISAQYLTSALSYAPKQLDTVVQAIQEHKEVIYFVLVGDSGNVSKSFNLANAQLQTYKITSSTISSDSNFYTILAIEKSQDNIFIE